MTQGLYLLGTSLCHDDMSMSMDDVRIITVSAFRYDL